MLSRTWGLNLDTITGFYRTFVTGFRGFGEDGESCGPLKYIMLGTNCAMVGPVSATERVGANTAVRCRCWKQALLADFKFTGSAGLCTALYARLL